MLLPQHHIRRYPFDYIVLFAKHGCQATLVEKEKAVLEEQSLAKRHDQQGFLYFAHCVEERVSFMTFGCILKDPIQSGLKMSDFHDSKKKWMCSTVFQYKSLHILYILHHITYYIMIYSMMFKVSKTVRADHGGWWNRSTTQESPKLHSRGSQKPPWLKPRRSNDARKKTRERSCQIRICVQSMSNCPVALTNVVKDPFIKLSFVHEA